MEWEWIDKPSMNVHFTDGTKWLCDEDNYNASYENILLIGTFSLLWNRLESEIFNYDLTRVNICSWGKKYKEKRLEEIDKFNKEEDEKIKEKLEKEIIKKEKIEKDLNELIKIMRKQINDYINFDSVRSDKMEMIRDFFFDYTKDKLEAEIEYNKTVERKEDRVNTLQNNEDYAERILRFFSVKEYPGISTSKINIERDFVGAFLTIQRVRNNLFHGKKSFYHIESQKSWFALFNDMLILVLNSKDYFAFK